ncbi:phosphohydrolase from calcineurin family [Lachnospiraceae bacterium KM106-2]|nr:phosphohydrolase from calcineurin family [Lachnospiraceae bacterium KM106-2]
MSKKGKKKRRLFLKGILLLLLLIGIEFYISNFLLTVTSYEVANEKIPKDFDGYRIVQLSDLHSMSFGSGNRNLVNCVRKQKPDAIMLTGDMINSTDTSYEVFYLLVDKLVKIAPVYFIVGNHEQIASSRLPEIYAYLERKNVTVLRNERVVLKRGSSSIDLYGMWFSLNYYRDLTSDYAKSVFFTEAKMERLLGKSDRKRFSLLLTHSPAYFDTYASWGADLVLSGHIHGGMIRIPFKGGLFSPEKEFFPRFDAGFFQNGDSSLIVSRGLGNGTRGFRFFNTPEIDLIVLRSR